jgi:phosphoglycolate phosphatase
LNFRAVIFDLDGTLLDTIDDLADAMNAALTAHGLPQRPDVNEHKYMVGDGVLNYVLRALPEDRRGDRRLVEALTKTYRANYFAGWKNKTRPYDGVIELVDALRNRGIRLAVLSNKPDDTTKLTVRQFVGPEHFDLVRGATEGVPLKPDPAAALAIANELGISPEQFAYVGDTATDMKTAVNAGMYPIGALWGFRKADELLAAGAAALAEKPIDVLRCF